MARHSHPIVNKRRLSHGRRRAVSRPRTRPVHHVPSPVRPIADAVYDIVIDDVIIDDIVIDNIVIDDITVIIVNYKTKHMIKGCLVSLLHCYPNISVVIVDNHSCDASTDYIRKVGNECDNVISVMLERNIGHGPAMHRAIVDNITTPLFFTLDTDTTIIKCGFLQSMYVLLGDGNYAIGWLRWVGRSTGVGVKQHIVRSAPKDKFLKYVHPHAALWRRDMYLELSPFFHHGAPSIQNMLDADERGFQVLAFPIEKYVHHMIAGTRRLASGWWDIKDDDNLIEWEPNKKYAI